LTPDLWLFIGEVSVQVILGIFTAVGVWFALSTRVTRLEEQHKATANLTLLQITNLKDIFLLKFDTLEKKVDLLLKEKEKGFKG
jgi:hypothetical protein